MKFQIGDWVKVKDNLVANKYYDGVVFAREMEKYRGKCYKIITNYCGATYHLDGCVRPTSTSAPWNWTDEMLEPIEDKKVPAKYKVGDKVKLRSDLVQGKLYGKIEAMYSMAKRAGEDTTVVEVFEHDDYAASYFIDGEPIYCYYSEEMFEEATDEAEWALKRVFNKEKLSEFDRFIEGEIVFRCQSRVEVLAIVDYIQKVNPLFERDRHFENNALKLGECCATRPLLIVHIPSSDIAITKTVAVEESKLTKEDTEFDLPIIDFDYSMFGK